MRDTKFDTTLKLWPITEEEEKVRDPVVCELDKLDTAVAKFKEMAKRGPYPRRSVSGTQAKLVLAMPEVRNAR